MLLLLLSVFHLAEKLKHYLEACKTRPKAIQEIKEGAGTFSPERDIKPECRKLRHREMESHLLFHTR